MTRRASPAPEAGKRARLHRIGLALLAFAVSYPAVALALIASQPLAGLAPGAGEGGLDFDALRNAAASGLPALESFEARDATTLAFRTYPSAAPTGTVLVLLHGSGWHGMQFASLASYLSANGIAHVVTPDLRGHGFAPTRRGDVDYVGQLEDDLADLIEVLRRRYDSPRIVVGGHSSGGGLAIRFAGGPYGGVPDAYLLLAPFLRHDAPTTRRNAGGWAQPLTRRLAGLTMLSAIGIHGFDHLAVIRFAMPRFVLDGPYGATATMSYSYRLNASLAPRPNYGHDLGAMQQPFLLVAGARDEAFLAEQYEPTISRFTEAGTYVVLPEVGHLDLLTDPRTMQTVAGWLDAAD